MLEAVRRFAAKVLLVHLILLVIVLALVVAMVRQMYASTRQEAIAQTSARQELLAQQTARGIAAHYHFIASDLDLLLRPRSDDPATAPAATAPRAVPVSEPMLGLIWQQLHGRVAQLFVVDHRINHVTFCYPPETRRYAEALLRHESDWIKTVDDVRISPYIPLPVPRPATTATAPATQEFTTGAHLIALPAVGRPRKPAGPPGGPPGPGGAPPAGPADSPAVTVVAVVPIEAVKTRFFDPLNAERKVTAVLFDDTATALVAVDPNMAGRNAATAFSDPAARDAITRHVLNGEQGSSVVDHPASLGNATLPPQIISADSFKSLGGARWTVLISSPLADTDAVVDRMFRKSLLWTLFFIGAVTTLLASTTSVMIRSRVRVERERHELLTRELNQARQIQMAWLPDAAKATPGLDVAAVNLPANHISGDFYDWFTLPDGRAALSIGDVTGHGMSAAFLMSTTQLLVRTTLPRTLDPGRCLEEVNRQLCAQPFRGQFVTITLLLLDTQTGTVEVASAGHPAPLLDTGSGFQPLPIESDLVLGVDPDVTYPAFGFVLHPNDRLVLYTDGVIEAESPAGAQFALPNLVAALNNTTSAPTPPSRPSPSTLLAQAVNAVKTFAGPHPLADDLTLVTAQVHPTDT